MKKVTILASNNSAASTFTGPLDVFSQAGVLWNRIFGRPANACFKPELVTIDGRAIECSSGLQVQPRRSIREVTDTDMIVIASIGNIDEALAAHAETIPWLRRHHGRGTPIASICTGAFLLADTGLLDGKKATTHWGYSPLFRQRYPNVHLKPERMITDEGDLFCSAGFMAGIDLSLYLAEKFCGREIALRCAKSMIYDIHRASQSPYHVFQARRNHHDEQILAVQRDLEENYANKFHIHLLARENGMSVRSFERRFKMATGDTPIRYLQRVRVEVAKKLLEETRQTFDEIAYRVGYDDSGFFRKIFKRLTRLRPLEYRDKFQLS